ncbi:Protein XRI1 [Apostasia shenzhenica]|uniref:Protein XRI1 n=1 Tax=Apostasia shenzhenica TaxID=1088818 RepID=A0A2I0AZH4_9ASPA|nr:Protein XRI1 [Apostasia shenzhenica]
MGTSDMWEWQEDDYYLMEDRRSGISHCLWDELHKTEGSLLYMLEEQTPIKDCTDFHCQNAQALENTNKLLEECRDSSQQKRRRMLHFPSECNENNFGSFHSSSVFLKSKEREDALIDEEPSTSVNDEWNADWVVGTPDGSCALNSEGWLDNCLNEGMIQCGTDETTEFVEDLNCVEKFVQQGHAPAEMETDLLQQGKASHARKASKGRRHIIRAATNLTTSIAYPFALIKPCGAEGDLTLKDINHRIHTPLSSRSKQMQEEIPLLHYPTSAFSGKPVVVKTKIHTEGGKGSITIMRTKG